MKSLRNLAGSSGPALAADFAVFQIQKTTKEPAKISIESTNIQIGQQPTPFGIQNNEVDPIFLKIKYSLLNLWAIRGLTHHDTPKGAVPNTRFKALPVTQPLLLLGDVTWRNGS